MNKPMVGTLSFAVAGGGLLIGCAPSPAPPPPPDPVPALGCYSGNPDVDVKIVGEVGTVGALEVYDAGSDCTTNDIVGPLSITFVEAADAIEAATACQLLDPENETWVDLSSLTTPAPGLAGYWSCSDKS